MNLVNNVFKNLLNKDKNIKGRYRIQNSKNRIHKVIFNLLTNNYKLYFFYNISFNNTFPSLKYYYIIYTYDNSVTYKKEIKTSSRITYASNK